MPFTHSQKRELDITDLSQYVMASGSNIPLDKASFELRIVPKIVEQLRELMKDSIERTIERDLLSRGEL
jgi:hypothetical protein